MVLVLNWRRFMLQRETIWYWWQGIFSKLTELKSELEKQFSVSVKVIEKDLSVPDAAREVYDETTTMNINVITLSIMRGL